MWHTWCPINGVECARGWLVALEQHAQVDRILALKAKPDKALFELTPQAVRLLLHQGRVRHSAHSALLRAPPCWPAAGSGASETVLRD